MAPVVVVVVAAAVVGVATVAIGMLCMCYALSMDGNGLRIDSIRYLDDS